MFGTGEMLIIAVVAIIVVDPKKLPDLMKGLGKAINEFKQMSNDVKQSFERESEAADFEKRKAEAEEQLFGKGSATAQADSTAAESAAEPAAEPEMSDAERASQEAELQSGPHADGTADEPAAEGSPHLEQPPVERAAALAAETAEAQAAAAAPVSETISETPVETPAGTEAPAPEYPVAPIAPPVSATLGGLASETTAEAVSAPVSETSPAVHEEAAPPAVHEEAAPPAPTDGSPPPPPPPTGDDAVGEGQSGRMSLFGHLQDLRVRLTRCAIGVVVGFLVCYAFAGQMLKILMQPMLDSLKQSHFIYTIPTEAFFVEMKVAFVAGIFAASPYLFYQLWRFVSPGLYSHERRWIIPIAFFSALCFTSGAMFGYFVVFPFGFEFFASYASDILMFTPKLDEYLDFVLKLLFAFGIVFELPLFLFFLARLGIVTHVGLRKKRKYAILTSFIVAAALTPPDAVSQTMMAVPLCILYEIGIWVAFFFGKKPKPEPKPEAEAAA